MDVSNYANNRGAIRECNTCGLATCLMCLGNESLHKAAHPCLATIQGLCGGNIPRASNVSLKYMEPLYPSYYCIMAHTQGHSCLVCCFMAFLPSLYSHTFLIRPHFLFIHLTMMHQHSTFSAFQVVPISPFLFQLFLWCKVCCSCFVMLVGLCCLHGPSRFSLYCKYMYAAWHFPSDRNFQSKWHS